MNSPRHRNSNDASHALRFSSLPAWAHANGHPPEFEMQARWNKTQPAFVAMPQLGRSFRTSCLMGLVAFGALALGIFVAAGETCAAHEAGTPGNYSRSTLAPITATGNEAPRNGSCKRKHAPGRLGHSKAML
ncbi:hypothetical protein [Variovorax sp. Varisp62]|uniref:hypothetical protein n=1 Tax=Variovorax sp. Varisp62 TaxID=3243049 RepID=UPI0039B498BE